MKKITQIAAASVAATLLLLCPLAPLNAQASTPKRNVDTLANAFARLGVAYLDIPASPDQLSDCVDQKNYACLSLYKLGRAAVQRIFDRGRDTALTRTLDALQTHCRQPEAVDKRNVTSPWNTCSGAATALYFFYKRPEDDKIRHAFAQFDPSLIKHIFEDAEGAGEWCNNRPDKEAWLTLIESWEVLDQPNDGGHTRKGFATVFGFPAPTASWLLLIDPEYIPDPKLEAKIDAVLKHSTHYAELQHGLASFAAAPAQPAPARTR